MKHHFGEHNKSDSDWLQAHFFVSQMSKYDLYS